MQRNHRHKETLVLPFECKFAISVYDDDIIADETSYEGEKKNCCDNVKAQ